MGRPHRGVERVKARVVTTSLGYLLVVWCSGVALAGIGLAPRHALAISLLVWTMIYLVVLSLLKEAAEQQEE